MKKGFDNEKYLQLQSEQIRRRIDQFGGKLYLEFGGKLFDDYHASRVLPGFEPDSKMRMLCKLSADAEIIITINGCDIEKSKVRSDLGITYDEDVLRLIGIFRSMGLYVGSVVITRYTGQDCVDAFRRRLAAVGVRSFLHYPIAGYPSDISHIVSDEGYGKNDYIETTKPLVVVTAPGPGSGKMATCLSQLYHEYRRGIKAGYAKFETFPIWNLPLKHPVNVAYEAATVDLDDLNMIDPFHLEKYGVTTVNYNRDVEIFPVLRAMLEKIQGESPYFSPTDMGVNMAGYCIFDDDAVKEAAEREILRRYYQTAVAEKRCGSDGSQTQKMELMLNRAEIATTVRPVIAAAAARAEVSGSPAGALELPDGDIVTGKTTTLLEATAALLLNALKRLAGIDQETDIISPQALEPICNLKVRHLHHKNPRLHADEVLIALSISSTRNADAAKALEQLEKLRGCDAHYTVILSRMDEKTHKALGIYATSEPKYEVKPV